MTTKRPRRTYTSDLKKKLIELRKRNKQLEMENDILKQAALILVRE